MSGFGREPGDGQGTVIKILNTPRLEFHIREIPPDLESKPTYEAARVNRKLRAQVGNPLFDSMVQPYNDLYESIIAPHKGGLDAIRLNVDNEDSEAFLSFFLKTPGVRRRLEDVAFLDAAEDPREVVMFNGLVRTIEEPRGTVAAWAFGRKKPGLQAVQS